MPRHELRIWWEIKYAAPGGYRTAYFSSWTDAFDIARELELRRVKYHCRSVNAHQLVGPSRLPAA